jgi:hypothetical protein
MSRELIKYVVYLVKYICYKVPTFFVICAGEMYLRIGLLSHRLLLRLVECRALKCRCQLPYMHIHAHTDFLILKKDVHINKLIVAYLRKTYLGTQRVIHTFFRVSAGWPRV